MKILKQLSKILISAFFFLFIQSAQAQEIKEIWPNIEKKDVHNSQSSNNIDSSSDVKHLEDIKVVIPTLFGVYHNII